LDENKGTPLFVPEVPQSALKELEDTLSSRWIGEGPKVKKFEQRFKETFLGDYDPIAVGSGTDAIHLAYLLAGLGPGDEVLTPLFTCTATNIPLLYVGATPVFIDVNPETLNVDVADIERKITDKTKAVVVVDYGGIPNDYEAIARICKARGLTLIADAAHSLGSKYKGTYVGQLADFTIFSFQAIKTLTTGDGGLLAIRKGAEHADLARRLRWFGIDRHAKSSGIWDNDIVDVGYKYQMTDIAASLGLSGLDSVESVIESRNKRFQAYESALRGIDGITVLGVSENEDYFNSAWLFTILVEERREDLVNSLRAAGIESGQVHYRNDRYSIFAESRGQFPSMDEVEGKYLVLPIHRGVDEQTIQRVAHVLRSGW
jgi:dTDP-4-amino-4,6-dideoxygalactose transaminase